jgi:transposase
VIAAEIMAAMPEIGQIDNKRVASLAGLAPHAFESGNFTGRRVTSGGRKRLKHVLFIGALAASRSRKTIEDGQINPLRAFYDRLIENGKEKRCALTALSRKIIVICNSKVRDACYPQLIPTAL